MYKIAIQCKDRDSGKTGCFMYNPEHAHGLRAMSHVYSNLVELFDSPLYKHCKRLGEIEDIKPV